MPRSTLALLALAAPALAQPALPAIDGDFTDWQPGVTVASDSDDIRLRVNLPRPMTLQNGDRTVALRIDLDGDESTGATHGEFEGTDLSVYFSPPHRGEVGNGAAVTIHIDEFDASISPAAAGLIVAPSHASDTLEIRLDRRFALAADDIITFDQQGLVRWALTPLDSEGKPTEIWSFGSGGVVAGADPVLGDASLPEKPAGAVRVASMNVLWASPMISPEPFERVMNAIDADIWLFQEWDIRERDQPRLPLDVTEEWLETRLVPNTDWTVLASDQRGVLIASRLPLKPIGPTGVKATAIADRRAVIERSVRYIPALAETPIGKILLGCVHLKCCGGVGGEEDRERIAEAVAASAALHESLAATDADGVVLGGDFNLVGSPIPLAILKNGLDPAGGDLVESDARVLGDDSVYTWTEAGSRFLTGRLDYMLTSPSSLKVENAWVLDSARLSDTSLSAIGVSRDDSRASDHRPLVVDLVRAN